MPPVYPFNCSECNSNFDLLMTMKEYDTWEATICLECPAEITKKHRVMCAANVTRASYVDGTKRPGFAEAKEALKLKRLSYNMKPEDRKEIKRTIKEVEKKI